ncbi:MAG TPA: hypothetical protein VGB38_00655 [bacterium]
MTVKAVALVSSGLDSLLAAKIIRDQGVDVHALHCAFSFGSASKTDRIGALRESMAGFGIPLRVQNITEPIVNILRHPAHGFGSAVNPCIDCHLFMLRQAREWMSSIGARFVVTGDVVGQRPMSQNRPTLFHIENLADLKRLVLRPLSAKRLPVTIPEEEKWVDRETLYAIGGRGRKDQEALASRLGIEHYFQPAGGCILTDPLFAKRVKTFIRFRGQECLTAEAMYLFRLGRHFWMGNGLWIVAGRNESDNGALAAFRNGRWTLAPEDEKGPVVIADGVGNEADLRLAAGITARYSRHGVAIVARFGNAEKRMETEPVTDGFLVEHRL